MKEEVMSVEECLANGIVPIGDLDFYTGGAGNIPEDDYALFFEFMMEPQKEGKQSNWEPRLGTLITFHSLTDAEFRNGGARTKFLAFGKGAHKTYMPDPDTQGKTLLVRENAPPFRPPNSSNWVVFLQSMRDAVGGIEKGIFVGDATVIDGMHAHVQNIPEPTERQTFNKNAAMTGDAGAAEPTRKPGFIPVVQEIKAAPWRGEDCGIPDDEAPAPPAKKGVVKGAPAPAKAAAKATAKPAAKKAASDDDEVKEAAESGVAGVLGKNRKGCERLVLRTQTFKAVKASQGEDMATKVVEKFFDGEDDDLVSIIDGMDFELTGTRITPKA